MPRLGGRAVLLVGAYVGLILAVIVVGFLGAAVGVWASILWGAALIADLSFYLRRRSLPPQTNL